MSTRSRLMKNLDISLARRNDRKLGLSYDTRREVFKKIYWKSFVAMKK